jgi:hypothetical protein
MRSYDPFPGFGEEVKDDGSCAQAEGEHLFDVEFVIPSKSHEPVVLWGDGDHPKGVFHVAFEHDTVATGLEDHR